MLFEKKEPPIVVSVGGSLIIPNDSIDTDFLIKFNNFIRNYVKKGKRFFLITGGGRYMRYYRDAATTIISDVTSEDLDWLAIHVTRVNGHLLRTIFQDIANPRIIENYDRKLKNWKEPVVIGAGWKPGWSTDYDAVILARDYGANLVINLSNIYHVYDKDPNKFKDARPIKKITWDELEDILPRKWTPGLNSPFDPVATQLAKKLQLTVVVTNGTDFDNLENIIEGKTFKGTVITPFRIDSAFYDRDYYIGKKGGHRFAYAESFFGKAFHSLANFYRAFLIKIFLNPKNCLDVGCGIGSLVYWLRFLGVDAYGIDLSKHAVELAGKKVRPYLKVGDITNIPHKENEFDLVLTFDVLEHVERDKIKKAIEETIRVSNKYIFHKIYTTENIWFNLFHKPDFSIVSFFPKKYWQKFFTEFSTTNLVRPKLVLPSFIETKFLLKKK